MPNDAARAEFWKEFILSRCHYPAPERLRAHFSAATPHNFCECGCNSFEIVVSKGAAVPLTAPGRSGMFFEADFRMGDGRQLEVLLFADEQGNLAGVDVQCQGNTEPVPDELCLDDEPFHVWSSEKAILR